MQLNIDGVLEAALYVDDLDAAAAFYGDLLELEEILRLEGRHVFFRCGSTVVLLFRAEATVKPPSDSALPVPTHGAVGPGHLCFSVPNERMELLLERLTKGDIEIEADFHWPNGARSVYVRDPAGNSIEFAEPKLWGY